MSIQNLFLTHEVKCIGPADLTQCGLQPRLGGPCTSHTWLKETFSCVWQEFWVAGRQWTASPNRASLGLRTHPRHDLKVLPVLSGRSDFIILRREGRKSPPWILRTNWYLQNDIEEKLKQTPPCCVHNWILWLSPHNCNYTLKYRGAHDYRSPTVMFSCLRLPEADFFLYYLSTFLLRLVSFFNKTRQQ